MQQLLQNSRYELPGHTVLILNPAAGHRLPALRKLVPKPIDLFLGIAVDKERDSLGKIEVLRAAVQRHELLPLQLKGERHYLAGPTWPTLFIAGDAEDLGVVKERDVIIRRLLCFMIEPQKGSDTLHLCLLGYEM